VLPGYALLKALELPRFIGAVDAALLTMGASLGIVVVVSVGLGLTFAADRGPEVSTVLGAFVVVMLVAARLGARETIASEVPLGVVGTRGAWPTLRVRRQSTPMWLLGMILSVAALVLAAAGNQPQGSNVLQLWMTRGPGGATIGVYNASTETRLRVTIRPVQGGSESLDATIPVGRRWEQFVTFPTTWPPGAAIVASLSVAGDSTSLRVVKLAPEASSVP
jgi:hypothetical protein